MPWALGHRDAVAAELVNDVSQFIESGVDVRQGQGREVAETAGMVAFVVGARLVDVSGETSATTPQPARGCRDRPERADAYGFLDVT
ncbi:hypothetical protein [Streptomyces sp. NPDC005795]|uniref:hypothetical protein n=1 Tax=Streptomyces sp. NPDC005795 TaxID=3154677 RepID=UPI0033EA78B6